MSYLDILKTKTDININKQNSVSCKFIAALPVTADAHRVVMYGHFVFTIESCYQEQQ